MRLLGGILLCFGLMYLFAFVNELMVSGENPGSTLELYGRIFLLRLPTLVAGAASTYLGWISLFRLKESVVWDRRAGKGEIVILSILLLTIAYLFISIFINNNYR